MRLARLVPLLLVVTAMTASSAAAYDDSFGDFSCSFSGTTTKLWTSPGILAYNNDVFDNDIAGDPLMLDDTDRTDYTLEGSADCVFTDRAGETKDAGPAVLDFTEQGRIVNQVCGNEQWKGQAYLEDPNGTTDIEMDLDYTLQAGHGDVYAASAYGGVLANPNPEIIDTFMGTGKVTVTPTEGDCQTTDVTEMLVAGTLAGSFAGDEGAL